MKRRLGSLSLRVVLGAALASTAACSGGDDAPGATPAPAGPTSSSGAATGTPTGAPSAPSTPEVEPASGPDLSQTRLTVRAPQGWELTREGDPFTGQATDGLSSIIVTEIEDFGDGTLSLREQARIALESSAYLQTPSIVDPVEIDGRQWFHISGPMDKVRTIDSFGMSEDGTSYTVSITITRSDSEAERQAVVDAVLASISVA